MAKQETEQETEQETKQEKKQETKKTYVEDKEYTFLRTYIGKHGVFHSGRKYKLKKEQFEATKEDLKE
ncbi:MAG: hypothetical protein LBH75_04665 [Treponema sp.]|jgi:hypothetical protein|nr:hypothetical protein [Treponema sp.]